MKKSNYKSLFMLGVYIFLFGNNLSAQPGEKTETKIPAVSKPYRYETGKIVYEHMMNSRNINMVTSVDTVYFKDWGTTKTTFRKQKGGETELILENNKGVYTYSPKQKSGIKTKPIVIATYRSLEEQAEEMGEKEAEKYYEENRIDRFPNEILLGFDCEVFELNKSIKNWIHKGIVLKMENKMGSMTIKSEAKSFEPDIKINEKIFSFPNGLTEADFKEVQ